MSKETSDNERKVMDALASVDTPTICNAIEIASGERRDFGFTRKTMVMPEAGARSFIGRARTATQRAAKRPGPSDPLEKRIEYYRYVAKPGAVVVIEDLDDPPGLGAFWGEVHTTVHAGFKVAGVVTNGSVRDLDVLHPGLPILAGEVTPSHAFVDIEEIDIDVDINGMKVSPGDIIHADKHGAVVVPDGLLEKLPEALEKLLKDEKVFIDLALRDDFDMDMFEKALRDARDVH